MKDFSAIVPSSSSNSTAAVTLPAGHDDATAFLDEFEDDLDGGLQKPINLHQVLQARPTDVPKLQLENTTNPEEESRRGRCLQRAGLKILAYGIHLPQNARGTYSPILEQNWIRKFIQ